MLKHTFVWFAAHADQFGSLHTVRVTAQGSRNGFLLRCADVNLMESICDQNFERIHLTAIQFSRNDLDFCGPFGCQPFCSKLNAQGLVLLIGSQLGDLTSFGRLEQDASPDLASQLEPRCFMLGDGGRSLASDPNWQVGALLFHAICKFRRIFEILWQVAEWFAPAVSLLLKCVPFFFAPPLVQLPVALAPLSTYNIFKMLLVVASGSLVGSLATGLCVERIWGAHPSSKTRSRESPAAAATPKSSGTFTCWLLPAWITAAGNHTHTCCTCLLNSQKLCAWLLGSSCCRDVSGIASALYAKQGCMLTTCRQLIVWQW